MPHYYEGLPELEETRQYYATVRIQDHQRKFGTSIGFREYVEAFRMYGLLYDAGHRLRDTYQGMAA